MFFKNIRKEKKMEMTDGELAVTQTEKAIINKITSELWHEIALCDSKEIKEYLEGLIMRIEKIKA